MPRSGRNQTSQSKHDRRVGQRAEELEGKGYKVRADVSGYPQPLTVGGYRPDIMAEKGNKKIIIEVETPDSADSERDIKQQGAFQRAARRDPNLEYKREITG